MNYSWFNLNGGESHAMINHSYLLDSLVLLWRFIWSKDAKWARSSEGVWGPRGTTPSLASQQANISEIHWTISQMNEAISYALDMYNSVYLSQYMNQQFNYICLLIQIGCFNCRWLPSVAWLWYYRSLRQPVSLLFPPLFFHSGMRNRGGNCLSSCLTQN